MKKEMRTELKIGLVVYGVSSIFNKFFLLPDMIMGILMGLAISFEIVGILPEKKYQRIKLWKKKWIFSRCKN